MSVFLVSNELIDGNTRSIFHNHVPDIFDRENSKISRVCIEAIEFDVSFPSIKKSDSPHISSVILGEELITKDFNTFHSILKKSDEFKMFYELYSNIHRRIFMYHDSITINITEEDGIFHTIYFNFTMGYITHLVYFNDITFNINSLNPISFFNENVFLFESSPFSSSSKGECMINFKHTYFLSENIINLLGCNIPEYDSEYTNNFYRSLWIDGDYNFSPTPRELYPLKWNEKESTSSIELYNLWIKECIIELSISTPYSSSLNALRHHLLFNKINPLYIQAPYYSQLFSHLFMIRTKIRLDLSLDGLGYSDSYYTEFNVPKLKKVNYGYSDSDGKKSYFIPGVDTRCDNKINLLSNFPDIVYIQCNFVRPSIYCGKLKNIISVFYF